MKFGLGESPTRVEDGRLLTGRGRYTDDVDLPRQVYAHIVRSPVARAAITSVDTSDAKAMPGVLGVFTGAGPTEDEWKWGVDSMRQVAEHAGEVGVTSNRKIVPAIIWGKEVLST